MGNSGTILRTTNGGVNWNTQSCGTTYELYSVSFTDVNTGTAVGVPGIILRTTNGGGNWTAQSCGTSNCLNAVSFTDANTGTAVGEYGTILRTTNGGLTFAKNTGQLNIPQYFMLEQNYPNPFNANTIIRFQIKDSRFVKLKVFDLLGREVAVLVNEKLQAGFYQVTFEAGDLPSGIYFYRLTAGEFTDTRKMLMIK